MEGQQGRAGLKRHVEAGRDLVDVQECYRRVENLRRALQVSLILVWFNEMLLANALALS